MIKPLVRIAIASTALMLVGVASLFVGAIPISPWQLAEWMFSGNATSLSATEWTILIELRFPRLLTAMLVGASLGCAGTGFQALFRNSLADPFIIGASSGAALGVAIAIVCGWQISFLGLKAISFSALLGSLGVVLVVLAIGSLSRRSSSLTLLLAGVALSSMINSVVSLMMFWSEEKVGVIFAWLTGSLASSDWPSIVSTSLIAIIGLALLWSLARPMDAYSLGDSASQSLGMNLTLFRGLLVAGASIATGAAVSAGGIIGFVGLIAPHMARWTIGPKHFWLVPMSGCYGAIILIVSDGFARTLVAPTELPVGSVTVLLGSPFFLGLLLFRNRSNDLLGGGS